MILITPLAADGGWPASGEIDIVESRGNAHGFDAEVCVCVCMCVCSVYITLSHCSSGSWWFGHSFNNAALGTILRRESVSEDTRFI